MPEHMSWWECAGFFVAWNALCVLGMVLQARQRRAEREARMAERREQYPDWR